jgi:hypothetical protein
MFHLHPVGRVRNNSGKLLQKTLVSSDIESVRQNVWLYETVMNNTSPNVKKESSPHSERNIILDVERKPSGLRSCTRWWCYGYSNCSKRTRHIVVGATCWAACVRRTLARRLSSARLNMHSSASPARALLRLQRSPSYDDQWRENCMCSEVYAEDASLHTMLQMLHHELRREFGAYWCILGTCSCPF